MRVIRHRHGEYSKIVLTQFTILNEIYYESFKIRLAAVTDFLIEIYFLVPFVLIPL